MGCLCGFHRTEAAQEFEEKESTEVSTPIFNPPRLVQCATTVQRAIQQLIDVPMNHSVQVSPDLGPSARIVTFMIQNLEASPVRLFLTNVPITRPSPQLPFAEIQPGASPVFGIGSQAFTAGALVWDLTNWWLIGEPGFGVYCIVATLTAFPMPG